MLSKEKEELILKEFCPRKLTTYEMAEIAIYLKNTFAISQGKVAESLGITRSALNYSVNKHKKEIEEKQAYKAEKLIKIKK
ncbi:hypothetical protein ACWOAH_02250 [Vagococcus vulneris]|uniref:Uncharacterized protein n=1 Tax=Vagococcus vulneris TaxID=1977869 RepID=A0A430A165_9ENTE|nr:hypothetical protein [Vagococcus vulneris]RSU00114.1 hypothetical protein CBF37_02100 [Vagococcus vulneris]